MAKAMYEIHLWCERCLLWIGHYKLDRHYASAQMPTAIKEHEAEPRHADAILNYDWVGEFEDFEDFHE